MKHETGSLAAPDGITLFTRSWMPESGLRGLVLLVHGVAEHSGRYRHVAEALTGQGYGVYTLDLRGHGESPGRRSFVERYTQYLDDLAVYLEEIKTAHPGVPVVILGHSMGGIITLAFTRRHQEALAGMITSGAPVDLGAITPGLLQAVARPLANVIPVLPMVGFDAADMSRDPAVRTAYDNDPLNYRGKLTVRQAVEMVNMADDARAGLPAIQIPCLCMHGGADKVVQPSALDVLAAELGTADKTIKHYDGLFHEIFNEVEKDVVLADVLTWLDARLPA